VEMRQSGRVAETIWLLFQLLNQNQSHPHWLQRGASTKQVSSVGMERMMQRGADWEGSQTQGWDAEHEVGKNEKEKRDAWPGW